MNLETIRKQVDKYKKEFIKDFGTNEEAIINKINSIFEESVNKVIYDMLGIENRWGQLVVKTWCSSRRDNLPVFNYLRSEVGKVKVKEVIENIFDDFDLVLTDKEKKELKASYKKEYISKLKESLNELAEEKAKEDAEALFKQMIEEG